MNFKCDWVFQRIIRLVSSVQTAALHQTLPCEHSRLHLYILHNDNLLLHFVLDNVERLFDLVDHVKSLNVLSDDCMRVAQG